ncbi:MAG: TRIC cation channel family protein, partial [Clostridia bacterium]|nr:TRIC cation channel family protein [Clostridia bacterium]
GGMIRDILLNEVPFVLKKRIYALATAAGAAIYYVIYTLSPENGAIAMIIGALSTITIRLLATIFKWNMPKAIRFSEFRSENGDENKK